MAKNPLLDFKKFEHVSSTKDHTILKHKDGHTLKIAHKSLGPDFQKQLEAMSSLPKNNGNVLKKEPKLMSDGGKVSEINPKLEQSKRIPPKQHMADGGEASKESGMSNDALISNLDVLGQSKPAADELIKRANSPSPTPQPEAKGGRIKMAEGSPDIPNAPDEVPAPAPNPDAPQAPTTSDTDQSQTSDPDESYATKAGRFLSKDVSVPVIKGLMALGHGMYHYAQDTAKDTAEGIQGAADEFHKAFPSSSDTSGQLPGPPEPPPLPDSMNSNTDQKVQENQDNTKQMASNQPTDVPAPSAPSGGVPATPSSTLTPGAIPKYQDSAQDAMQQVEKATPQQQYANMTQEEKNNFDQQKAAWENDLVNGHITPKTYSDLFNNKGTLGKIGSIFGMLVGGAGSGLARQPNLAFNMIQNELDRDFEGQKQSKNNAQNFLRIMQQDQMNKAETGRLTTENAVQALGLARVHAQDAVLHSLIMERDKLPVDSAQWKAADQGLAMMYPMFQQSASKAGDMVAGAKAYARMMSGNTAAGTGQSPIDYGRLTTLQRSGMMPSEDVNAATKEASQVEETRALRTEFNRTFNDLNGKLLAGNLTPGDRDSAKWIMAGKLQHASAGRFNLQDAEKQIDAMLPAAGDINSTRTNRLRRSNELFETMESGTPTLTRYHLKLPYQMPAQTNSLEGKTISNDQGQRMIMKNGQWVPIGG